MKANLISLALLISITVTAQTGLNNVSLGLLYSPNIANRTINDNSEISDIITDNEKPLFGNTFGVIFQYRLNIFFELESGLQFQIRGYQSDLAELYSTIPNMFIPEKTKYANRFYYLGLPLKLSVNKQFEKLSLYTSFGFIGNFLVKNKSWNIYITGEHTETFYSDNTFNYNRFALTSVISAGVNYNISQNITLRVAPTFQYDLTSIINKNTRTYLWDLGLNLGCMYNF